jgi:folate-dependent phosphoribosylglycinamide formyltransferase PurN
LSETQLVCLLFAPFIDNGKGLERFLRNCHPGMLVAMPDLHRAMQGLHAPEQVLKWITEVSGLPVRLVIRLYATGPVQIHAPTQLASESSASDEAHSAAPFERSTER